MKCEEKDKRRGTIVDSKQSTIKISTTHTSSSGKKDFNRNLKA